MSLAVNGMRMKTKLVIIILATTLLSLTLAGGALIVFERERARDELVMNVTLLGRIIANQSSAAILFNDPEAASQTLDTLRVKRDIVAAAIYDESGQVFARYNSGELRPYDFPASLSGKDEIAFKDSFLHVTEPVLMDGEQVGEVFLRTSLRELERLWLNLLIFAGATGLVVLLIALLLASRLQRLVSRPLEALTRTAEQIAIGRNYSLRAIRTSDDEVGTLVQAFNTMLEAIEQGNRELTDTNQRLGSSEEQLRAINERLEERVAERTGELQTLLDTLTVGVALMKDRVIDETNHRIDEMLGYQTGAQVGLPTRIWFANEEDWAAVGRDAYADVIWKGNTFIRDVMLVRTDGSEFWGRVSARAIDINEPARGVVAVLEDISDEREVMAEMEKARLLAEEATRMKSDFLANMSHEIRTPMNAIIGMLYLALKQDVPAHLQNYLTKAQGAAQSLLGIINDILDFSKIESGKLELEEVEFGLDTVLENLSDAMGFQAERKGLEFLIRYDVGIPPTLVGDPLRLGQILLNLCSNAVKFTDEGEVELAFQCLAMNERALTLQITVRDTGVGMDEEMHARLFQKFSQADQSTTRRFGGTGLGLAICKNLVEMMGGRIWVEDSRPGKGTTMCCTVNLRIAENALLHRHELLDQVGPLLKDLRVLVVDDNQVSRDIFAEMLRYFQMDVLVAASGPDALHQLEQTLDKPVDLVLMDWRMPGMNGDEVAKRIKTNPAIHYQPKVVMVTAYGREDVMKLAANAGVEHFLVKPVSPSTLLDTLLLALGRGRLLRQSAESDPALLNGDIDLSGARLLLVEDNDINREFAVELLQTLNLEVDSAVNGKEAVAMVQQRHYDGVLMDIQMPVMGGLEASRRIRALADQPGGESFATLPIIAMTALAMARDAENSRDAGMNDHITKPIAPDRLVATLARWIKVNPKRPQAAGARTEPESAKVETALPDMPSLDVTQGLRRIGGRAEAYVRQLRRFREHYCHMVDELRRLLAERGTSAAAEYCHSLKGVSGNIGATALYDCVDRMDRILKDGGTPEPADFDRMVTLADAVVADIAKLNGADRQSEPASDNSVDAESLLVILNELRHLLENDLGAAEDVLGRLRSATTAGSLAPYIEKIAAKIDNFDIDDAISQLDDLRSRMVALTDKP